MNPENSLDEVCARDGPFYPQCWPPLEKNDSREQESKMELLARDILPAAMVKKSQIMKELFMAKASGNKPSYSS